jgi:hypothetical protein
VVFDLRFEAVLNQKMSRFPEIEMTFPWQIKTRLLALLCLHTRVHKTSKQTRTSLDSLWRPMLAPYPAMCTLFIQNLEKRSQPVFLKTCTLRTSFTDRSLGCWLGDVSTWSIRFWATCTGWKSIWHAAVNHRQKGRTQSPYAGTPDGPGLGGPTMPLALLQFRDT